MARNKKKGTTEQLYTYWYRCCGISQRERKEERAKRILSPSRGQTSQRQPGAMQDALASLLCRTTDCTRYHLGKLS